MKTIAEKTDFNIIASLAQRSRNQKNTEIWNQMDTDFTTEFTEDTPACLAERAGNSEPVVSVLSVSSLPDNLWQAGVVNHFKEFLILILWFHKKLKTIAVDTITENPCQKNKVLHICGTGFYLDAEVPAEFKEKSKAEIANFMLQEIEDGVGNTGIRAGAIKVAADLPPTSLEQRIMQAAAIVQQETGVLINTHSSCGAKEHLDLLIKFGASAEKVLLGHVDRKLSLDFHVALLDRGASLCFTEFGLEGLKRWKIFLALLKRRLPGSREK